MGTVTGIQAVTAIQDKCQKWLAFDHAKSLRRSVVTYSEKGC